MTPPAGESPSAVEYRALLEHSPDLVAVVRDGHVTYESPAVERVLGHETLLEERVLDYVHPEDEADLRGALAAVAGSEAATSEALTFRFRDAEGAWRWLETTVSAHPEAPIDGCVVSARDATDRVAARRDREVKSRAMDEAPIGITLTDPDLSDNPVVYANEGFSRVTGYPLEEVMGRNCRFLQGPDTDPETVAEVRAAVDEERPVTVELLNYRRDGTEFWNRLHVTPLREDGAVTHFLGFQEDVTERRRREAAVRELHDATRDMFDETSTPAICQRAVEAAVDVLGLPHTGIHLFDGETGGLEPVAVSDSLSEHLSGEPPTFAPGEGLVWDAVEAGTTAVYDDVTDRDPYSADTGVRSEMHLPLGDRGVMLVAAPVTGAFDEVDVSLAELLATNVAEALDRAARERRIDASRRELERQNERLDRFVSVVSHDLRNPLNAAAGHVELAREERDDEHLASAAEALERMSALLEDLLELARHGESVEDREPASLTALAESAWETAGAGTATLALAADLGTVQCDASRVQQLFENLFRNAVEHGSTSPRSNAREDAVEHAEEGVTVTVGAIEGGFYVADDGPGIPEADRDEVFEAGYSTNAGGTGFGLNIVREIVAAHGWDVRVTDSQSGGARFEVTGVDVTARGSP